MENNGNRFANLSASNAPRRPSTLRYLPCRKFNDDPVQEAVEAVQEAVDIIENIDSDLTNSDYSPPRFWASDLDESLNSVESGYFCGCIPKGLTSLISRLVRRFTRRSSASFAEHEDIRRILIGSNSTEGHYQT